RQNRLLLCSQAEDGIRDRNVTGVQTCALPILGKEEDNYEKADIHMLLESVFPVLPKREQQILKYIFFDNLSQQEVGELLGISQKIGRASCRERVYGPGRVGPVRRQMRRNGHTE